MFREHLLKWQFLVITYIISVCLAINTVISPRSEVGTISSIPEINQKSSSLVLKNDLTCQNHIDNMKCKWMKPASYHFDISDDDPCNFTCQYDVTNLPLSAIRLDVHLHYRNPLDIPTFISVQQSRHISSWTLPIVFHANKSQLYTSFETLLCPPLHSNKISSPNETIKVQITTPSRKPVKISLGLTNVSIAIELGKNVSISTSPVSPWFKVYSWNDDQQSVMVLAESIDQESKNCALLSVQNAQCPVGQDISGVRASGGRYQTFTERAGLVAYKQDFPDGIFIVVLPIPDTTLCKLDAKSKPFIKHQKTVNLNVVEHGTIMTTWYIYGSTAAVLIALVTVYTCCTIRVIKRQFGDETESEDHQPLMVESGGMMFCAAVNNLEESAQNVLSSEASANSDTTGVLGGTSSSSEINSKILQESISDQDLPSAPPALMAADNQQQIDAYQQIKLVRPSSTLAPKNVDNISQQYNPRIFLWWKNWARYESETSDAQVSQVGFQSNLFIMALFAALPTTELLRSYISVLMQSGNEDQCYFNSRCLTGFWFIPDFSRVFTNIGYILVSLGFYHIVKNHRKIMSTVRTRPKLDVGVSRHYGLWTSLAYGLAIQGVMSSLYHICPNSVTIRLDLMFMYIMSIILVVGIWGLRHGDVTHHVYPTVALVGVMLLMAEARDFLPSALFWTIMGTIHIFFTLTTSVLLSKFGTWNFSPSAMYKIWKNWHPVLAKMNNTSMNGLQGVRLVLGLMLNLGLVIYSSIMESDVYNHILIVCLSNVGLYFTNYVATKRLYYKERGSTLAWVSLGFSSIFWILALVAFTIHSTDSEATPSESRAKNQACFFFGVFDTHDAWHLTSSLALFTSFVGVLTLDDDLANTSADRIQVF
ncbi:unnamed protein product [Meganyctiphanes norvegica]|uniref:SID1 transmembrane family member 1 n=1 Tax=Meganyctiphanes norvegica TaxID=48144 RepID=A0AAV2QP08_MEGNR